MKNDTKDRPADERNEDTPAPEITKNGIRSLVLSQNYEDQIEAEDLLMDIPVRRPKKLEWVRVHPNHRLGPVALLEDDEEKIYLLSEDVHTAVHEEAKVVTLRQCITSTKVSFIWHVPCVQPDGADWSSWKSQRAAAEIGEESWIRMIWQREASNYKVRRKADYGEPAWPTQSIDELAETAFKGRIIDSLDHPVIRHLLEHE
jgi:hypothetical protein